MDQGGGPKEPPLVLTSELEDSAATGGDGDAATPSLAEVGDVSLAPEVSAIASDTAAGAGAATVIPLAGEAEEVPGVVPPATESSGLASGGVVEAVGATVAATTGASPDSGATVAVGPPVGCAGVVGTGGALVTPADGMGVALALCSSGGAMVAGPAVSEVALGVGEGVPGAAGVSVGSDSSTAAVVLPLGTLAANEVGDGLGVGLAFVDRVGVATTANIGTAEIASVTTPTGKDAREGSIDPAVGLPGAWSGSVSATAVAETLLAPVVAVLSSSATLAAPVVAPVGAGCRAMTLPGVPVSLGARGAGAIGTTPALPSSTMVAAVAPSGGVAGGCTT